MWSLAAVFLAAVCTTFDSGRKSRPGWSPYFCPLVEAQLPKEQFNVMFESLSETDAPMMVTRPEFMRRMRDMSALGGGMNMFGNMPEMHNLVVNTNHPLVIKIVAEKDEAVKKQLIKQSADLALLAQGLLKGEELTKFIKRSVEMIK